MSAVGRENTRINKILEWESELWSYIGRGDGVSCPIYDICDIKQRGGWCFNDNKEKFTVWYVYCPCAIDIDSYEGLGKPISFDAFRNIFRDNFPREWKPGRLFQLVELLADKYIRKAKLSQPPATPELLRYFDINPGVEIRPLLLKSHYGASWHQEDGWVIHINASEKPIYQRLTLFHEAFHVLAHCGTSLSCGEGGIKAGLFNEFVADYFSRCVLMPERWVKEKWAEVEGVEQMAEIFQVSLVSMFIRLRTMGLVW